MSQVLRFLVLFVTISLVTSLGGLILGTGRWLVINVEQCEDANQYELVFKLNRRKINRTHDCFYGSMNVDRQMNATYATIIDIYQLVDGGFKFYQTFNDDSACTLIKKHAEENFHRFLRLSHVDPPECPVEPGYYELKDFVMDYRELPVYGVYGTFSANAYLLFDGRKIGCIKILLNFDKRNDDEDDNDDDVFGFFK